jgi:DNA-binding NtrC family response regulator
VLSAIIRSSSKRATNLPTNDPVADVIGKAPAMQEVFRIIGHLSRSSINMLINSESGTKKVDSSCHTSPSTTC